MAWSEGFIPKSQAAQILDIANRQGFEKGSQAEKLLRKWLAQKPSEEFFQSSLRMIRVIEEIVKALEKS